MHNKSLSGTFLTALMLAAIILVSINCSNLANASTEVTGLISSNTTWTSSGSPYIITSDALVDSNVVLTIESGVVIKFDSGKKLLVDGTIVANGLESNPITFTSNAATPAPGDWGSINFRSNVASTLSWVIVSYGSNGIDVTSGSPSINNCLIQNNQGYGVYVSAGNPTITNTIISNNGKDGIWNYVGNIKVTNCTISNNSKNGIYKDSGSITIKDSHIINNVQSGVYGGAAGDKIYINDSKISYNGKDGITICYSDVIVNHAEISYNNQDGVHIESETLSGSATITASEISYNNGNGIYKSSGSIQISHNNVTGNQIGIAVTPFKFVSGSSYQEVSGLTTIEYNNIVNNIQYAIANIGPGTNSRGDVKSVIAKNNWWGTTDTAAIDQLIRDTKDDFNLGRVEYVPFLTQPDNASINVSPTPTPTPAPTPTASTNPSPSPSCGPETTPSPTFESELFRVVSNSTVSAFAYNSAIPEISFSVSGPSGTTGYVKITIAKSFMPNADNIQVYLDGNLINREITSNDDTWQVTFTYHHSSHQVTINTTQNPALPSWVWTTAAITAALAIAVTAGMIVFMKRKTPRIDNPNPPTY